MFGADKFSDADFKKLLTESSLLESDKPDKNGFVNVKFLDTAPEPFKLDAERVVDLVQVI